MKNGILDSAIRALCLLYLSHWADLFKNAIQRYDSAI